MPIDWKKLAEDMDARRTPEERERIRAYEEREARFDLTLEEIEGDFAVLGSRPVPQAASFAGIGSLSLPGRLPRAAAASRSDETEEYVVSSYRRPVGIRIEERHWSHRDAPHEVLSFKNAVTGHESYTLDVEFVSGLVDWVEREGKEFAICGGTASRYDRCVVDGAAVLDYLRRHRPALFPEIGPRP